MMSRPLFKKSVAELEELFQEWRESPERLRTLKAELDHRTRPKAVRLRERVEALLAGDSANTDVPPRETQKELMPGVREDVNQERRKRRDARRPSSSPTNTQSYLDPPSEFTIVQPLGTRPRPGAFRPTLKEDLELDISKDDPPVKVFRVALHELIREMRRRKVGRQQFALEDGYRVRTEVGSISYQFEFAEEANVFEGAKVEIVIAGRVVPGQLTALMQARIIITLQEDFGEHISSCTLRIDNTALLQALHDRLAAIDRGATDGFDADLAASVLTNAGDERPRARVRWPWPQSPTEKQREFVELAIANKVR